MAYPQQTNSFPLSGFSSNTLAGQSILDVFVLQDILELSDAEKLKANFRTNREVEDYLVKNRLVTTETINKAYSILLKLPYISLQNVELPEEALKLIPLKLALKYGIVPFSIKDKLIRIAVSRPADLLVKYPVSLARYFQDRNLAIELFITSDKDFSEAIKQYDKKKKTSLLLKRGSLPVVFLRNQIIADRYLKKFPKEFIDKYHIVVFGQNDVGDYLVACETPDVPITKKIINFIESENDVKIELFATSKEDVKFVLSQYDQPVNRKPKLDLSYTKESQEKTEKKDQESKITLKGFLGSFMKSGADEFTIDDYPKLGSFIKDESKPSGQSAQKSEKGQEEDRESAKPAQSQPEGTESGSGLAEKEVDQKDNNNIQPSPQKGESITTGGQKSAEKTSASSDNEKNMSESGGSELEKKDLGTYLDGKDVNSEKDLEEIVNESYVPKIVAGFVGFSLSRRASDIHVEPGTKHLRVRCRVDGILMDAVKIPMNLHPPIVSRVKIMSKLKIDETRVPQDGRFDVVFNKRNVDVRVSILPTVHGEKIVMRILDKDQSLLSLEDLGMQGSAFDRTIKAINKPYGIILSTGPTGSGKSTTLYAVINRLSVPGINIVTLEDPVEYEIAGINQCQVKPEIGFTFASGLRSVLRQDPNVIMVGEIRDAETAGMATHAALTGHLVLSTLHTNDAAGALPRLTNMGVEPFLITSSINLAIGQRLIRRICSKCREEMRIPPKLIDDIKNELLKINSHDPKDLSRIPKEVKLYYGKGCSECTNGFKGRIGLFEVMELNPQIEDLAVSKRPTNEIKDAAIKAGMITMKQDGIIKALNGLTTIDEVLQATTNN